MKSWLRHNGYLLAGAVIFAVLLAALSQWLAPEEGITVIIEPEWEVGEITPTPDCVSVRMDKTVFTTQESDILFHIKNNSEDAVIEHYGPPSLQYRVNGIWYWYYFELYPNTETISMPTLLPGEEGSWPLAPDRFGTYLPPGHYRAVFHIGHKKIRADQPDLSCDCVNEKFAGVEFDVVP